MTGKFIPTTELKIVIAASMINSQICEAVIYFRGTSPLISILQWQFTTVSQIF